MTQRLGCGKYGDLPLNEVPREYLEWLIRNNEEKNQSLRDELARRDLAEAASESMVEQMVKLGFREMAKKHHPDSGGTSAGMQEVNAAYEKLKEMLK
jgi:hypothetical protein